MNTSFLVYKGSYKIEPPLQKGQFNSMSYSFYKFIHIFSIFIILITLGIISALKDKPHKIFTIANGVAILIAFVAGFGLIARMDLNWPWPGWLWVKLIGWIFIGMGPKFAKCWGPLKTLLIYSTVIFIMVYMAIVKPF